MTEEKERFRTRLVFADEERLRSTGQVRINPIRPPFGLSALELIQIAPAIDTTQSALAVWPAANDSLEVWAIVDLGGDSERMRVGTGVMAFSPPSCLFVASDEPGHLRASQGGDILCELKRGELLPEALHFLNGEVVGTFFDSAIEHFDVTRRGLVPGADKEDRDHTQRLYRSLLSSILHEIRVQGRGGTLVVTKRVEPPIDRTRLSKISRLLKKSRHLINEPLRHKDSKNGEFKRPFFVSLCLRG